MHTLHYYVIKSKDDLYVANRTYPCLGKMRKKRKLITRLTVQNGIVGTKKKLLKEQEKIEKNIKRNGESLKLACRVKTVVLVIQL